MNKALYAVVPIVIVVIAIALVSGIERGNVQTTPTGTFQSYDNVPVQQSLLSLLNISNIESNQIVNGTAIVKGRAGDPPLFVNGTVLMNDGKPEVLYIGAEYCPYCAAERWPMIIALMRFGTFSGLKYMTSSSSDAFANTPTFTFNNSTYTSNYISFVPVETTTNKLVNGQYPTLQNTNSAQNATLFAYDQQGSIPFVDFGNRTVQVGANYDPQILGGMNWSQIASAIQNPNTQQAKGIIGSANLITAEICMIDNNTPSDVCSQPYVKQIENMSR